MPYVAGSDATFIKLGPGKLYAAAVGTAEPTDLTTALSATWLAGYLGFTDEGHTFTIAPSYDGVEVAESMLPIARVKTGVDMTLEFALAEVTAQNVQKALNGATITSSGTGATAVDSLEPLADGSTEARIAVLWQSDAGDERWVWRKCLQTGSVAIGRKKGSAKAVVPLSFLLEPVSSTVRPFRAIMKSTASIT
jgi:hypothetical protein